MISLLLSGMLLFPTPQPVQTPLFMTPLPRQTPITFETIPSQYDLSWIDGSLTAYYNGKDGMNGILGVTASGYDLNKGIQYEGFRILAGDGSIPLGTLIDIKLQTGEVINGVVLDRGGSIKGNHFDMVFGSYNECVEFGNQKIQWQEVGKIDLK